MATRREILLASAAPALALTAASAAALAATSSLNLSDPLGLMTALVKLRGSLDGRIAIWWMKGPRFGVSGAEVTPLFDNFVTSFHQFRKQDDGSFLVTVVELSYYVDLDSGKLLEKWRNPYTGELNDVEYIVFGPITSRLTPAGIESPGFTPGVELKVKPTIRLVGAHADDVWIAEDVRATIVPKSGDRPRYAGNDLATYFGSRRQIDNVSRPWADATIHYQSVTNWRSWMKLGGRDGHLMARSSGRKVWSPNDLPPDILAIARGQHPRIIADPRAALTAPQPEDSFRR
jgi:hypothetical protein